MNEIPQDETGDNEQELKARLEESRTQNGDNGSENAKAPAYHSQIEGAYELLESGEAVLPAATLDGLKVGHNALPTAPLALENVAANGGAVASVVLGVWAVAGSFLTSWSAINGVLGVLLGIWGLNSPKNKTAVVGIALSVIGIILCTITISEIISQMLVNPEAVESDF